jgi:hypothetical protein
MRIYFIFFLNFHVKGGDTIRMFILDKNTPVC